MANNINEMAVSVAEALKNNPRILEEFKANPNNAIKKVVNDDGISTVDIGSILSTLLQGSNDGGGLLGDLIGNLTGSSKNANGSKNVIGELIQELAKNIDINDLIGGFVSLFTDNETGKKKTTTKKTTASKKTSTTKKTTSKKSTTTKKKATDSDNLLGDIVEVIGNNIDVGDVIKALTDNKK